MVLAEKNGENCRNGRRSRGPSPNGHAQAESTSEDESMYSISYSIEFYRYSMIDIK